MVSKSKVKNAWGMPEGAELEMGQWELQVDAKMDQQQFRYACLQPPQNTVVVAPFQIWKCT